MSLDMDSGKRVRENRKENSQKKKGKERDTSVTRDSHPLHPLCAGRVFSFLLVLLFSFLPFPGWRAAVCQPANALSWNRRVLSSTHADRHCGQEPKRSSTAATYTYRVVCVWLTCRRVLFFPHTRPVYTIPSLAVRTPVFQRHFIPAEIGQQQRNEPPYISPTGQHTSNRSTQSALFQLRFSKEKQKAESSLIQELSNKSLIYIVYVYR
jgi:hypothetical protein